MEMTLERRVIDAYGSEQRVLQTRTSAGKDILAKIKSPLDRIFEDNKLNNNNLNNQLPE
jgi:cell division septum initiation protein DivIVA